MAPRISTYLFVPVISSITTAILFLIFSKIFAEISILYIGLAFASCMFFFTTAVLRNEAKQRSLRIRNRQIIEFFFYALTVSSIIIVLFIPVFEGSMLEWMRIPLLNWLRYLSSLLLTSFLPGYFLLKTLDRKDAIPISLVIVFSCLLSIFITFLAGFSILLSANPLNPSGLLAIITTNLTLGVVHYLTNRKKTRNYILTVDWVELGLISSILTVIAVGLVIAMVSNAPLTPGDMWNHYGTALDFSNGFPVYGGKLVTYPGGYLFAIYLSVLFSQSGIPPAIAEQGLYILSFMPILAFYSATKVWLSWDQSQKLFSKATMFSIFLGFGGLYAMYMRFELPAYATVQLLGIVTSKTYDIYMRILYIPDIVAPLWIIGLPIFFVFLYFLKAKIPKLTEAALISTMVLFGYLAYSPDILLSILITLMFVLLLRQRNDEKKGPYITLGLVAVALFDLAAPAQVYVLSSAGTVPSLTFVVSLILAALISLAELVKDRHPHLFSTHLRDVLAEELEKCWRYGRWVFIYLYVFFFVVWLTFLKDFNLWNWGGYTFTPFFVLPSRLGAVGLFALVSIAIYFKKIVHNRALLFFLLLIPIGFIMEQAANSYTIYPAYRYGTLTFVGACVIAAYGITSIVDRVSKSEPRSTKRSAVLFIVFGFLMISGMLSTALFYVNASYYSTGSKIPPEGLIAFDYIRQHAPANASVLTFTTDSASELRNFAGLNAVQDAQRWSQLLLSTSNPYIITYILSSSNIRYIYLAKRDDGFLNSSKLSYLVNYFPKAIENSYATIYEVPPLTAPSSQASFGILDFAPTISTLENTTWTDDSFTEGWHLYRQNEGVKNHQLDVENGTMEISVTSNQTGNSWTSWARSNLSLNTTTYPMVSFRYYVGNNLSWLTFQLWNSTSQVILYAGHLSDTIPTTKDFILPKGQTINRIEVTVETTDTAPAQTAARAYIDLIQFSAPTTTFEDDTFTKDWEFYQKYGNISDWNAHSNGNALEISVNSNQSGDTWVSYSHFLNLQTKNSVLSFRYKVDNDYTWFTIILQNASDRFFFYRGHLTDTTFTTKSYLLPEGQTITRVELMVETRNNTPSRTSAAAEVDSIEILPESKDDVLPSLFVSLLHSNYTPLYVDEVLLKNIQAYLNGYTYILLPSDPTIPVDGLLKWVSAGNTLIVLNTHGNGFYANLLGINDSSTLTSITKINSGEIIYINFSSLIAAGRESDILRPEFLDNFRDLLHSAQTSIKIVALPVYNSISGGIQVKGNLQIKTDALALQSSTNFVGFPSPLNRSSEIKLYGKINLTIKNSTMLIFPSESYMQIKPEDTPIEAQVSIGGIGKALMITDAAENYSIDAPASFKFNTNILSMYARLPSVNATGKIIFDQLDVHSALYVPLGGIVQQPAEIQGRIGFDTMYISNPETIFSKFEADGKILNLGPTASERTVPWAEVTSSPYNIAFNATYLLGIIIYIVKKGKARLS
jgi:hypothetical protein